jgi:Pyridine nucleotide-disulphide oxidoreductase
VKTIDGIERRLGWRLPGTIFGEDYLIEKLQGKSNVEVKLGSEMHAVHGDTHLTAIDIRDTRTGDVRRHDCGGLFIFIGADAETGWLPADIVRDARGYVLTGEDVKKAGRWSQRRDPYLLETSVPGVFACGDVRLSPVKRVASAVGEGSMAIALARQYLAYEGHSDGSHAEVRRFDRVRQCRIGLRSIPRDGQPRRTQLSDQFCVGRVQAGAQLLRGCGRKPIGQRRRELGNAPRDRLVGLMHADPTRREQRNGIDSGRTCQLGRMQ